MLILRQNNQINEHFPVSGKQGKTKSEREIIKRQVKRIVARRVQVSCSNISRVATILAVGSREEA